MPKRMYIIEGQTSEVKYIGGGWQLCPKCEGSGTIQVILGNITIEPCDVCNGQKIIDKVTGQPPENGRE